jgi:hypothetical protein
MTVKKGDRVIWRGRNAKVMAPPSEDGAVTLHAGQGQFVREVCVKDYAELPSPPAPKPVSTQKPARAPIAKARRKASTGKGK